MSICFLCIYVSCTINIPHRAVHETSIFQDSFGFSCLSPILLPRTDKGRVEKPPEKYSRMARWGAFLFVHFLWACKENVLWGAGAEKPRALPVSYASFPQFKKLHEWHDVGFAGRKNYAVYRGLLKYCSGPFFLFRRFLFELA